VASAVLSSRAVVVEGHLSLDKHLQHPAALLEFPAFTMSKIEAHPGKRLESRMSELSPGIADFTRREVMFLGRTKPVLTTGMVGPAVIVIHEVYGFTPTLARFCR
jgi:hypothetical protein